MDLLGLDEVDFEVFQPHKRRDSFYNETRLRVKRKLAKIGKALQRELPKGLGFQHRTSLSHPYIYNGYCVSSMRVYFFRKLAKGKLRGILGPDLGKDLDPGYMHPLIAVEISLEELRLELVIPQKAWWEGENWKRKCRDADRREELLGCLRGLKGFGFYIHNWKKRYDCEGMGRGDLEEYFSYYTPGVHDSFLRRVWLREEVLGGLSFGELRDGFLSLLPVFDFIVWTEKNNYIF